MDARTAWLVDVGSTFTKVAVVNLETGEVLATEQAPTTVTIDVTIGLNQAVERLESRLQMAMSDAEVRLASSSAAGGLGMVVVGFVPRLTVEAARQAALNAGAKVLEVFGYELTEDDIARIVARRPDMILISGGIDGGNRDMILANGAKLAAAPALNMPFVVAGNRSVSDRVAETLRNGGKQHVRVTENILPQLDRMNVEPAREVIRELFVEHITRAKGVDGVRARVSSLLMPTPMAVLEAVRLLADGVVASDRSGEGAGWGEVLAFEIGGATTNVHSISDGTPRGADVVQRGLPEPRAKRTVEGDLGIRWNATTILDLVGHKALEAHAGMTIPDLPERVRAMHKQVEQVPRDEAGHALDTALACAALQIASDRHAGYLESFYTPTGPVVMQYGKDLTGVTHVVGTGGVVVHGRYSQRIFNTVLRGAGPTPRLKPTAPRFYVDSRYILYAGGLLATAEPKAALRLLQRNLVVLGN